MGEKLVYRIVAKLCGEENSCSGSPGNQFMLPGFCPVPQTSPNMQAYLSHVPSFKLALLHFLVDSPHSNFRKVEEWEKARKVTGVDEEYDVFMEACSFYQVV